ncbi:hypothetical protein T10_6225 [Trichinella papuae]|uniref:Uncharacterized protein n=1 Tax=Trichinella papuae TaxID=268474 RepID=A0A0V1MPZ5_9BILA|nr:hypothetical protein T10_6225 [Trichinella papuae]
MWIRYATPGIVPEDHGPTIGTRQSTGAGACLCTLHSEPCDLFCGGPYHPVENFRNAFPYERASGAGVEKTIYRNGVAFWVVQFRTSSFSTLLRLVGHYYWLLSSFNLSRAVRRSLRGISGGCFLVTTPDPWNEGILLHSPGSSSTGSAIKGVCCQFTASSSVWSGRTVLRKPPDAPFKLL